jgi:23S rRNA pseudouridine2605 synthase
MSGDGNQSGRNRKPRPSGGSRPSGNSRSSSDSRGNSGSGKSFGNSKGPKTTRGGNRLTAEINMKTAIENLVRKNLLAELKKTKIKRNLLSRKEDSIK